MTPAEPAKTARITILGTPRFKVFLKEEARKEGISDSQFVHQRCEVDVRSTDEAVLAALRDQK